MDTTKLHQVAAAVMAEAGVKEFIPLSHDERYEARSWVEGKRLTSPVGDTPEELAILAHEAGHIATTVDPTDPVEIMRLHWGLAQATPLEFEATRWGFQAIRRHGGETTAEMQDSARKALASYAQGDIENGYRVPGEAVAFITGDLDL